MLSKSGIGTARTGVIWYANDIEITIPAGKGGTLKAIELALETVWTSAVNAGGLVKLHNSSADWDPLYLLTPQPCSLTAGGGYCAPMIYPVEKELPGNSSVYVDYEPYNAASSQLRVTLIWELGAKPKKETFAGYIHPLKAAAVTATARASPGIYAVPGGKGGRLVTIYHCALGTTETIVSGGGLVELENNAYDMTPCHWQTGITGGVGAAISVVNYPEKILYDAPCPQNSTFTSYYTPLNDQSQTLTTILLWERPVRRTVA